VSYQIADFASQVALKAANYRAYSNRTAELNAIATALGSDTTKHDTTIKTAPAGLRPGLAGNTRFTNDVLHVVNAGKGGNLTAAAMAAAITAGLANEIPPTNTAPPVVSGTATVGSLLSCTQGTWTYGQTYAYQWLRGGATIAGATNATRTLIAADSGTNISCRVTATNPAGSTPATSNAIAVA
jgi:hypothetical protein